MIESQDSNRITELRDEIAYLNQAVESAKKWQSRSWLKRASHTWTPPKRSHPEPLMASTAEISLTEAELLFEIRYLTLAVESAEKWQRRSRAKRAFHKWRAPKRPQVEPILVQVAVPEKAEQPAQPPLPPPYFIASSLIRPALQLANGQAFTTEQTRFLATSYVHLDTCLRSSHFSELLEKVRVLDGSIPRLESWYHCTPVIPPLAPTQYQLFGEISNNLAPRIETDYRDATVLIEGNDTLQNILIAVLDKADQKYNTGDFVSALSQSDRDTAVRTLANILFGLNTKHIVTNPKSFAWDVFVRFGKQLSQFTQLHLAVDESDSDLELEQFSRLFPFLTSVLCANEASLARISHFNIPDKYKNKISIITKNTETIFKQNSIIKQFNNTAIESENKQNAYDVSAILNLHREGLLCGPTLTNFTLAIAHARNTGLRVEGIVVCDRSDALTREMIPEHFRVLETNFGDPALARNAGIAESQGNYACFLDGDDFWCEDWLVACHCYFATNPEPCVLHPALNLYFGTSQGIMPHPDSMHPAFDMDCLKVENLWTSPSFAPRDLFLKHPYRASDLKLGFGHEDWHWNSQLLANGIAHRPCANTFHIIRQKRQSRSSECDSLDVRVWPTALSALSFKTHLKKGATISLLHATRKRAEKALQTRNLWIEKAKYPQLIEHIFAYDNDDLESRAAFQNVRHIEIQDGGTCIKAWNTAAELSTGDILLQLSDDWIPSDFWDEALLSRLDINKAQVLAISDGHRKDQLLCMAILTRKRLNDQKYFFHPDFESVYSDDWFTFAAYKDGVVVEAKDIIFTHDHPYHKGTEEDETYKHNNQPARYKRGEDTFKRLKAEVYGLAQ